MGDPQVNLGQVLNDQVDESPNAQIKRVMA